MCKTPLSRGAFDPVKTVGVKRSFVFCRNRAQFSIDIAPQPLMQGWADQDLAARGAVAVTSRPVGRLTDDRQLHTVVRADKPLKGLAAVNANADGAGDLAATLALLADFCHRRLHCQRRAHCLLMPHRIGLRTAEDGQDGITSNFVYRAVVLENGVDQS